MEEQINLSFSAIEKTLWNLTLETFQRSLVEILSLLDKYLMAKRNKSRYEYKERKEKYPKIKLSKLSIKIALCQPDRFSVLKLEGLKLFCRINKIIKFFNCFAAIGNKKF